MDFNRTWTKFALEAEHEMFGMDRIATVHNKLQAELTRVREELRRASDERDRGGPLPPVVDRRDPGPR